MSEGPRAQPQHCLSEIYAAPSWLCKAVNINSVFWVCHLVKLMVFINKFTRPSRCFLGVI